MLVSRGISSRTRPAWRAQSRIHRHKRRIRCSVPWDAAGGNRHGYAGYEFEPVTSYAFYHVRERPLSSDLGRWSRRDLLDYVDGSNLYQFGASNPCAMIDATGMCPVQANRCGPEIAESFETVMRENCQYIRRLRKQGFIIGWVEFYNLVKAGSSWDYKQFYFGISCKVNPFAWQGFTYATCPSGTCQFTIQLCQNCLRKDVIGNLNFGHVGRCAGFSLEQLLTGSALAAAAGGIPDDACDRAAIEAGYWLGASFLGAPLDRSLCDAIEQFDLFQHCGRPDCTNCPCELDVSWLP